MQRSVKIGISLPKDDFGKIEEISRRMGISRRPVVLLSRDEAYKVRNAVTVAEINTTIRNIPVEVPLGKEDGLAKKSVSLTRYDYHNKKSSS